MGKILDLYWHFAEPGDTYLGRILAGMDPNQESFGSLPPHWNVDNPMGNEEICEAMNLMFATILQKLGGSAVDPTGILLLCLASVVWNVDFLKTTAAAIPGHPFDMIPLLTNASLLAELKLLVTIESEGHMTVATGIPPHIRQAVLIKDTLGVCKETLEAVKNLTDGVKEAVKQGFEEKAEESGQMTSERMKIMIDEYHNKVETLINTKLTNLNFPLNPDPNRNDEAGNDQDDGIVFAEGEGELVVVNNNQTIRHRLYTYEGRFWHVPKDFEFPTGGHLDTGWKLWLCGLSSNETIDNGIRVQAPVRPFRLFKSTMLPLDVRRKFELNWKPIFSLMQGAPDMNIAPTMDHTAASISLSFSVGKEYLKTRVSYVFESERSTPDQWGISTWSRKVCRSSIMKNGNDSDKSHLPAATHRNRPRQQRQPRKKPLAHVRRTRRRLVERATDGAGLPVEEPAAGATINDDTEEDDGGDGRLPRQVDEELAATNDAATNDTNDDGDGDGLLPLLNLTATAAARGEEIEREVNQAMEGELREQRRVANVGRPDGHGGVLFVGPRF